MPRNEVNIYNFGRSLEMRKARERYFARQRAHQLRIRQSEEAERKNLLENRDRIRGQLRFNRWAIPLLHTSGITAIFGGGVLAQLKDENAGYILAAGIAASVLGFSQSLYSQAKGFTTESLDRFQAQLHQNHNILPDEGYFKRQREKYFPIPRYSGFNSSTLASSSYHNDTPETFWPTEEYSDQE